MATRSLSASAAISRTMAMFTEPPVRLALVGGGERRRRGYRHRLAVTGELAVARLGDENRGFALTAHVTLAHEVCHGVYDSFGASGWPQQLSSASVPLTTSTSVSHCAQRRRLPTAIGMEVRI